MYQLPKDPLMLMSFLNEKLRGRYASLEALCDDFEVDANYLIETLATIGYQYDKQLNQFKSIN